LQRANDEGLLASGHVARAAEVEEHERVEDHDVHAAQLLAQEREQAHEERSHYVTIHQLAHPDLQI